MREHGHIEEQQKRMETQRNVEGYRVEIAHNSERGETHDRAGKLPPASVVMSHS